MRTKMKMENKNAGKNRNIGKNKKTKRSIKNLLNKSLVFCMTLFLIFGIGGGVSAYNIEGGGVCGCNSCDDCTNALNDASCTEVKLTADITNHAGRCIDNPSGFNNKVFDCQENTIEGTNSDYGIYLNGKSGNTIKNCEITKFHMGMYFWEASNNIILNNHIHHNKQCFPNGCDGYGIWFERGSSNNLISNNDISDNLNDGIIFHITRTGYCDPSGCVTYPKPDNNRVVDNIVCNNFFNGDILNSNGGINNNGEKNTCDKTENFNDNGYIGCSLLCDGSAGTPDCTCSDCSDCEDKLNNPSCSVVYLTADITNHEGSCIDNPSGFNNKVFDCQGHAINGDDSGSDHGIYLSSKTKNTIKNCKITDFYIGILLYQSTYNNITDNTANSNTGTGIAISGDSARYNTLTNNILNSNGYYGMSSSGYWCSLRYNYAYDNTMCGNDVKDVSTCRSYNVYGDGNTCDTFFTRNFGAGMIGCSYSCP